MALAFLCVIGLACGKEPTEAGNKPTSEPSATLTEQTAAPTEMPAAPTNTPTPSNTPTNTPTPTNTNTPTPLSEEAKKLLSQHDNKVTTTKYTTMYNSFESGEYVFPVISITTMDAAPVYKSASTVSCIVDTFNCAEEYQISSFAEIRVRGNSSAAPSAGGSSTDSNRAKYPDDSYPYKIKFDSKENLLGLNSGYAFKDWVLLEINKSVLENIFAFRLANSLHSGQYYVSDGCLVHVYLNGNYMGIYNLCEQSEVKKHRVNVNEPEEGYTGTDIGYFVEIDNYAYSKSNTNPWFKYYFEKASVTDIYGTTRVLKYKYYTIHSDTTCDEQVTFIQKYITNVFKILLEAVENKKYYTFDENWNLIDATGIYDNAKDCIGAVMDLDSVVASYLVEEITMDADRGEGSFYMAVDFSEKSKFKKLTFLCPWDFEYGYSKSTLETLLAGAYDNVFYKGEGGDDRSNPWFILLVKEDWFRDMVCAKWAEFYDGGAYDQLITELMAYAESGSNDRTLANKNMKAVGKKQYGTFTSLVAENGIVRKRVKWLNDNWYGSGVTR